MCVKELLLCFLLLFIGKNCIAQDSILVKPNVRYERNAIHNFIFGKHYRTLWSTPVKMPILDMCHEAGGLHPVKIGGGLETTNLRLKSSAGSEYSLRLIVKDPSKKLNQQIKKSFLGKAIKEQNSANNPYAALVVSELSKALGLFHATPKLVYVSNDSTLGQYCNLVCNQIAFLEERPNDNNAAHFGLADVSKVVSTETMLEHIYQDHSNSVDQNMFLKCRLFDMLISDWGRHEDQWRWAVYSNDKKNIYMPIPRDRDHAMYQFDDGLLPWILVNTAQPKFQSFNKKYKNVKGLNESALFLDQRFLNEKSLHDWLKSANEIQISLTDSLIEEAVNKLPKEIFDEVGVMTIKKLRIRRDKLMYAAHKAYKLLSNEVLIAGSDKDELIIVNRLSVSETEIIILNCKKENKTDTLFQRIFNSKETSQIKIFGQGGDDTFLIEGKEAKGTKIVLIGGEGIDSYYDKTKKNGIIKRNIIIDELEGRRLYLYDGNKTKVLTTPPNGRYKFLRIRHREKKK